MTRNKDTTFFFLLDPPSVFFVSLRIGFGVVNPTLLLLPNWDASHMMKLQIL